MRRILPVVLAICFAGSASAQFSVGAGGNYTYFMGTHKTYTPGFHARVQYDKGPYGISLQYTYHVPFHILFVGPTDRPSTSPGSTDTKLDLRFQSLDLLVRRRILGDKDTKTKLYGGLGASWTLLVDKETYIAASPGTSRFPLEDGHKRSISIDAMIGSEYKLGRVSLYAEAVYTHPTRKWNVKETLNALSPNLGLQLGIKLPLH